ncbi:MAG: hypothetical protein AAF494_01905 [Pseudomonadota bacterium]
MSPLPYKAALADAQAALLEAKTLLQSEISDYPQPISGCDAQYVCLISEPISLEPERQAPHMTAM